MGSFAVFHNGKQIRVYGFQLFSFRDRERAKRLALELARANAAQGYPCTVEEFGSSGRFGTLVFSA